MRKLHPKKLTALVLTLTMLFSLVGTIGALAEAERKYAAEFSINGAFVDFENEPYSTSNTVFVPLEELCGYLGIGVSRSDSIYTINRMNDTLVMEIGNVGINKNGNTVNLKHGLTEHNGVTYAPVEIFSEGLECPVTFSNDFRRADLRPGFYSIAISAENAAAIRATLPEDDTLVTTTGGSDELFYKPEGFPEEERAVFYRVDLSDFAEKGISSAILNLNVKRINSNQWQNLGVQRTKDWKKGELNFINQPELYEGQQVKQGLPTEVNASQKNWGDMQIDITSLAQSAISDGEALSVKLLGIPYAKLENPNKPQIYVKGVNTATPPRIDIEVNASYTFPVKEVETESTGTDEYRFNELKPLYTLGVFTEEDEFPLDLTEGVTRGEFLTYAMRLRGNDIPVGSAEQFFSDVPVNNRYFSVTSSAHQLGYITGWQGIEFRPDDTITVGEAVTILGRMLNYNVYADERGGFTPGYFQAAAHGDLYVGVNDSTAKLSFKQMLKLLVNALDAKMLNVYSYSSNGSAQYTFDENMTILTEFWDAEKVEGKITGSHYSSITGSFGENKIYINNVEYLCDNADYNCLLGYDVKGYVNSDNEFIFIGTTSKIETAIDIAEIKNVTKSGNIIKISYQDGSDYEDESINIQNPIIYNLKSVANSDKNAKLFEADGGQVLILDNGTIVIDAYNTVIVSLVDKEDEIIHDLYDDYSNRIELDNKDYYQLIDVDGKDVVLENLRSDDVISVAYSLDKKIVRGILSNNSFTGEIESIQDNGPDATAEISGKEYKFANYYKVDGNANDWTKDIKLSLSGTFFVDAFGQIVGFRVNASGEYPGYILAIGKASRSGLENKLLAAITTKAAVDYVEFEFAEKVKIDGAKAKKYNLDEILALPQFTDNGQFKKQGIIYTLNDEGKIKAIDTAIDATVANPETYGDDIKYTLVKRHNINYTIKASQDERTGSAADGNNSYLRHKSSGTLSNRYWLNKDKTLYVMAPDAETIVGSDKYYYPTSDLDEFKYLPNTLSNDDYKHFDIYTVGNRTPDVLIAFYRGAATSTLSGGFAVVNGISYKYNDELADTETVLEYVTSPGKITEAVLSENCEYKKVGGDALTRNDIKIGDVIRLGKNYKDEIGIVQKYYDYETKTVYATSEGVGENAPNIMYAFDSAPGYKNFVDNLSSPTKSLWFKTSAFTAVYPYTVEGRDIVMYQGTANDIIDYETVPYASSVVFYMTDYMSLSGAAIVAPISDSVSGYYRISFVDSANDTVGDLPATQFKDKGETLDNVSVTLTRPGNKQFVGWEYNGNVYTNDQLSNIVAGEENITLTAVWEDTHTITFKDKAGNNIVGDPIVGIAGEEVTLPDYDISNFRLTGWSTTANAEVAEYNVGGTYTIGDEDVTLYAVGTPIVTYAVTFNSDGHGTAPGVMNVEEGTYTEPLPDMDNVEGYRFDGWKIGSTKYDPGDVYGPVNADTEFTARWTASVDKSFEFVGQALVKNADATSVGVTQSDYYALYQDNTAFYKFKIPTGYTVEEALSNFHIRFHKKRTINVKAHVVTSDFWQNAGDTLTAADLAKFTSIEKTEFATLSTTQGDGYTSSNTLKYETAWNTTDKTALASAINTLADNSYQYVVIAVTSTNTSSNGVNLIDYKQSKYIGYLPELVTKAFPDAE